MTDAEQRQVAALRTQAQALRVRAQAIEARMQCRWANAPSSFITGSSGRQHSGLDKRWERAESANRNDSQRVNRLRERAAALEMGARRIETAEADAQRKTRRRDQGQRELQQLRAARRAAPLCERIMCGVFPTGWSWADTAVERDGDYRKLAYMSFSKLELELQPDCPPEFKPYLEAEAAKLQARRGERYVVSTCGQYVTLGER
jgi:hypothetical protein